MGQGFSDSVLRALHLLFPRPGMLFPQVPSRLAPSHPWLHLKCYSSQEPSLTTSTLLISRNYSFPITLFQPYYHFILILTFLGSVTFGLCLPLDCELLGAGRWCLHSWTHSVWPTVGTQWILDSWHQFKETGRGPGEEELQAPTRPTELALQVRTFPINEFLPQS